MKRSKGTMVHWCLRCRKCIRSTYLGICWIRIGSGRNASAVKDFDLKFTLESKGSPYFLGNIFLLYEATPSWVVPKCLNRGTAEETCFLYSLENCIFGDLVRWINQLQSTTIFFVATVDRIANAWNKVFRSSDVLREYPRNYSIFTKYCFSMCFNNVVIIWARFPRSRFPTIFFVKISICSYQKPGWPCYNRDLGSRPGWKSFPYEHSKDLSIWAR